MCINYTECDPAVLDLVDPAVLPGMINQNRPLLCIPINVYLHTTNIMCINIKVIDLLISKYYCVYIARVAGDEGYAGDEGMINQNIPLLCIPINV